MGTGRGPAAYPAITFRRGLPILAPAHHHLLVQQTKAFAGIAYSAAGRTDESRQISDEVWQAFRESGLPLATFPEAYGGLGLSEPEHQIELCTLLRNLGAADLSIARLFEGHVNAIALVSRYGSRSQIERLANDVRGGSLAGVWGAEDAHGLACRPHQGGCQFEGRKILASGAGFVDRPIVTLTTTGGPLMYLLDLGDDATSDVKVDLADWRALGMRATATGTVDFTGMVVAADRQIGNPGDYQRQPFFSAGAWRFCAAHLGAMERLTRLYKEQLLARGRADDPYQLQRLAQCAAACGSALFWVEEAARRFGDETLQPASVVAFCNLTRMVTERAALDVIELVQRGVGLRAFMHPNPIERICRDLSTYLRQPVPDLAMSDAARAILNGDFAVGASGEGETIF